MIILCIFQRWASTILFGYFGYLRFSYLSLTQKKDSIEQKYHVYLFSSHLISLSHLIVDKSRISSISLPYLLDFITARPNLKYVSVKSNGISNISKMNVLN